MADPLHKTLTVRGPDGSMIRIGTEGPQSGWRRFVARTGSKIPAVFKGDTPIWLAATYGIALLFGPAALAWLWATKEWNKGGSLHHYDELREPTLGVVVTVVLLAALDSTYGRNKISEARDRANVARDEARLRELEANKHVSDRDRRLRSMRRYLVHGIKEAMQAFVLGEKDRVTVFSCCHRDGAYDFEIHCPYSQRDAYRNMDWISAPMQTILEHVASSKRRFDHHISTSYSPNDGGSAYWEAWRKELDGVVEIEPDDCDLYPVSIVAIPIEEYDETIGVVMFETSGELKSGQSKKRARPKIEVGLAKIRDQMKSGLVDLHRYRSEANEV